jgi:hypothetical protein
VKGKKIIIDLTAIIGILSAVALGLYHLSYTYPLGLTRDEWEAVWCFSTFGFLFNVSLLLCFSLKSYLKWIFMCVFAPYFLLLLIHESSSYLAIKIVDSETWRWIWSGILSIAILAGLFYFVLKAHDED